MTLVENMSEPERRSWANLIVDISVFVVFLKTMLGNHGVRSMDASDVFGLYIWLIVATVVMHIIIAIVFSVRGKSAGYESDERDRDIERRGARNGFWLVSILINIAIFMLLMENMFGAEYRPQLGLSLTDPSHMFFVLMATMFLGDIVYRGTMVLVYRQGAI